jgi:hypothetical protein
VRLTLEGSFLSTFDGAAYNISLASGISGIQPNLKLSSLGFEDFAMIVRFKVSG